MEPLVPQDFESRVREYWGWIAVTLFLLVTVDLLTTTFAVRQFGLSAEGNPLMRWLIAEGPIVLLGAHLLAVVLAATLCFGIIEMIRQTPEPHRPTMALVFETWIGLLISFGLFLFANNLSAIVLQSSLL